MRRPSRATEEDVIRAVLGRLSVRPTLEVRGGGWVAEEDKNSKGQVQASATGRPTLGAGPRSWTS